METIKDTNDPKNNRIYNDDVNINWEDSRSEHFPFFKHIIAGKIFIFLYIKAHVLELRNIATHMQVGEKNFGFWQTFLSLYRNEGILRFWRGASIIASGCIPAHATYFTTYELGKIYLAKNDGEFHFLGAALTGGLATIFHDGFLTPTDVIKQRMQLGGINVLKKIIKNEGLLSLYRSYPITVLMNIPYASIVVSVNENLKVLIQPQEKKHKLLWYLFSAGTAGGIAAVLTTPLDVIKTKLQTQNEKSSLDKLKKQTNNDIIKIKNTNRMGLKTKLKEINYKNKILNEKLMTFSSIHNENEFHKAHEEEVIQYKIRYKDIKTTINNIIAEDGYKGFTRGISARLLAHIPATALSWGTYETIKSLLHVEKHE